MYEHIKHIVSEGTAHTEASKALILLHGRGANAPGILKLAAHLKLKQTAFIAPEATNNSWYPYSFMAPDEQNQPALDSALKVLGEVVNDINQSGINSENIMFLGFSQGACLALEFTARNAKRYGGVVAFTGGLIGEHLDPDRYQGDFGQTPILITTGDPDPHVPLSRVKESVELLKDLNADVSLKVYPGRPHTIEFEEIKLARVVFDSHGRYE